MTIHFFLCSYLENHIPLMPKSIDDMALEEIWADTPGRREGEFVGTKEEAISKGWLFDGKDAICPKCKSLSKIDTSG